MAGKTPRKAAKSSTARRTTAKSKGGKAAKSGSSAARKRGVTDAGSDGQERAAGRRASELIDHRIRDLGGWRGETLARMRALILEADPDMTEEWKWMGTPVWSHHGNVCTGEVYAKVVKLTFARGASVPDPARLFNSSLEGNTRRAIDIHEGEVVDARAFKALVRAAVAKNSALQGGAASERSRESRPVKLLSGGNPQIAKGEGNAPVQAYISAMPGWKRDVGRRLDALIERSVPGVRKAVKWNSPFYGVEDRGWFLNFHCFTRYVKVAFFRGTSLRPPPPGESKHPNVRYLDIREGEQVDEAQIADWVKQASRLPGEQM
jgi:hypothetical protein